MEVLECKGHLLQVVRIQRFLHDWSGADPIGCRVPDLLTPCFVPGSISICCKVRSYCVAFRFVIGCHWLCKYDVTLTATCDDRWYLTGPSAVANVEACLVEKHHFLQDHARMCYWADML